MAGIGSTIDETELTASVTKPITLLGVTMVYSAPLVTMLSSQEMAPLAD